VVEMNGPGIAVISRLTETLGYDNMYRSRMWNVLDQDPNKPQFGFRTDTSSRKQLMMHVHSALNSNQLWTRDASLISELRTMEFDDQGTERARGKNKDDLVFALALALEGRYSSNGPAGSPRPKAAPTDDKRSYEDKVWHAVRAKQEHQDDRNSRRDRGPRPRWSGRGPRRFPRR